MPRTPDRKPGPLVEDEELRFETPSGSTPSKPGAVTYDPAGNGALLIRDGIGTYNPRDAVTGDQVKVSANDTAADYLFQKLQSTDGTVVITEANDGGNEKVDLSVDITDTFRADATEAVALAETSLTSYQDAFSGASLSVQANGDYLVLFEVSAQVTNANGNGEIGIAKNSIAGILAGSERPIYSIFQSSVVAVKRANGLVIGDTIHGVFRHVNSPGSTQLYNRSLTFFRIAG